MYRHILIPTDGSTLSDQAIAAGIDLARALGARVTALHVIPEPDSCDIDVWSAGEGVDDAERRYQATREKLAVGYLGVARQAAQAAGVPCECLSVRGSHPHSAILQAARRKGCDLIVMASHGPAGQGALLMGSETLKVMTLGEIPVLVSRTGRTAGAPAGG
jgi:nucleotide-binding universal stress UspA family protein